MAEKISFADVHRLRWRGQNPSTWSARQWAVSVTQRSAGAAGTDTVQVITLTGTQTCDSLSSHTHWLFRRICDLLSRFGLKISRYVHHHSGAASHNLSSKNFNDRAKKTVALWFGASCQCSKNTDAWLDIPHVWKWTERRWSQRYESTPAKGVVTNLGIIHYIHIQLFSLTPCN